MQLDRETVKLSTSSFPKPAWMRCWHRWKKREKTTDGLLVLELYCSSCHHITKVRHRVSPSETNPFEDLDGLLIE